MSKDIPLKQAFNKFVGKEVPVKKTLKTIGGRGHEAYEMDQKHPVLEDMRQVAADMGLKMRIWGPDMVGTMDYREDRVNAYVTKDTQGKWKVSNRFEIG